MDNPNKCKLCNSSLTGDEKALYMKLISRNAHEFLCLKCLAKKLQCDQKALQELIRYYRESGNCTLFR